MRPLALLAACVTYVVDLLAGIRAHDRLGYEGEAAGLGVAVLGRLVLCLVPFASWASVAAPQRGSQPLAGGVLLLGLLPTSGLALCLLVLYLRFAPQ